MSVDVRTDGFAVERTTIPVRAPSAHRRGPMSVDVRIDGFAVRADDDP